MREKRGLSLNITQIFSGFCERNNGPIGPFSRFFKRKSELSAIKAHATRLEDSKFWRKN